MRQDRASIRTLCSGDAATGAWNVVTRRGFVVLVGHAAPLVAAACGGIGPGAPSTTLAKPASITAWFPVSGTYVPFLQSQGELFHQATPNIRVNVEAPGGEGKLQAAVLAGDPPDIVQSNYIPMFNWAKQGALEPVDAYLDRRGKGDFYDWAREGSTVDGKMYEWPWMMNPTGAVANRSLFVEKNAAHLLPKPGPKADWTLDQWKAAIKAVTTLTGDPDRDVYGTGFLAGSTGGDYWQMMYLWSNGAELYNRDQTKVTICSPEGYAGLQMLVDLVHRDRVAAPGVERLTSGDLVEMFFRKRIGILNGSPSTVGDAEQRLKDGRIPPPFEAQFFPVPHAPGKKSLAFVAIQSFLVFRQERDKDRLRAAMQFGYFVTDNPAQKAITSIGQLPVRKSVGNIYADDPNRTTALAVIDNGRDMGHFPDNGEIRKLWQQAAQAAFSLQKTPREALDEMCRLSEPIMAKNAR